MRYLQDEERILLTARELVYLARHRYQIHPIFEEEEPFKDSNQEFYRLQFLGHKEPFDLFYNEEGQEFHFRISTYVDDITDPILTAIFQTAGDPSQPQEEELKQARGEAFVAAYILEESTGMPYKIRIMYVNPQWELPFVVEETPTPEDLSSFFQKLIRAAEVHAKPEMERVVYRLPKMVKAKFPYSSIREGQKQLMEQVYITVKYKKQLFACAPTGIGKTMAVLYPAIRGMGEGYTQKIFYCTSKNTTADSCIAALQKLQDAGCEIRGLQMTAKEQICPGNLACRKRIPCIYSATAPGREDLAARELLQKHLACVTAKDLLCVAEQYYVCPYELSLRYAQYADVVLCDYNYVFDPRIAIRRFFLEKGNYTFLVDEAHNLVERARTMYSAKWSSAEFEPVIQVLEPYKDVQASLIRLRDAFIQELLKEVERKTDPNGNEYGFASKKEVPLALEQALCGFLCIAECLLPKCNQDVGNILRPYVYNLQHVLSLLESFDEHSILFYSLEKEVLELQTLCLDPGCMIAKRLSLGDSAVLFSATLTPASYYVRVLGGDRSSMALEVPSPFPKEHLCIAVLDKIATSLSKREDTLMDVARAIARTVKAKPGNYMVFCPSYAYLNRIHGLLEKLIPGLPTCLQKPHMTREERAAFLNRFDEHSKTALIGFCVTGGIYSEGIDLVGKRLIGAIICGVGLPGLSNEREAIREYYEEREEDGRGFAYVYPGMNRVLQAAGRVIRTAEDRGVVLLIDERFSQPEYRKLIPEHWQGLHFVGDLESLSHLLGCFWKGLPL